MEVRADVLVDGNEASGNEEQEQEEYQNQQDGVQSEAENQSQLFDKDDNGNDETGEQEEEVWRSILYVAEFVLSLAEKYYVQILLL